MSVAITILSNGREMDPTYELESLNIQCELNRIPHAEVILHDGNVPEQRFAISETEFFAPGNKIEISLARDGDRAKRVFEGIVVRHGIEASRNSSVLEVGLKDAAIKLTGARRTAVYRDKQDSEIIKELLAGAGLKTGTVAATSTKHPEIMQYYCTDWDFITSRAEMQGLFISVDKGVVSAQIPNVTAAAAAHFEWGADIYDFEFQADASYQFAQVEAMSWDPKNQNIATTAADSSVPSHPGNLSASKVANLIGFHKNTLMSIVPLETTELKAWADGAMIRSRNAMLRGRFSVDGLNNLKLLDVIELAGFGQRFNGKAVVSGISHRVHDGIWVTDIQFGVSPESLIYRERVTDVPAAGMLPALLGLQIGVITNFKDDPDKEFRVEVKIPAVTPGDGTVWARLCSLDAGKGRGFFFRPEVGDEVVVGFLNNDPRYPVVIGSFYGSKNSPPADFSNVTEKNIKKGFVTKSGTTITFVDDSPASVFIQTPNKNKIVLDDNAKGIKLTDENGNSVTMDQSGIVIKSSKDLKLDGSAGSVEISGTKVDVK
jgi:Rhs element Vgr protein